MKCPECSKEINDSAKFCKYCGKKIEDTNLIPEISEEPPIKESIFTVCPSCGKEMQAHKAFCTNCGNPLKGAEAQENISGKEKSNGSKRKCLKVIVCLVLLLIIGSAVIVTMCFKNFGTDKSDKVVEKNDEDEREDDEDIEKSSDEGENDNSTEEENDNSTEEENDNSTEEENDNSTEEENDNSTEEENETESSLDIEAEVAKIREIYNTIVTGIENNDYQQKTIEDGFATYSDNNGLKSIYISKEYSEINYDCSYYFDNDTLVFAYYEGESSHRFYFKDDKMIRWRKCEDAENAEEGINHDMEDTAKYSQWESTVQQNAKVLKLAWNAAGTLEGGAEYK